MADMDVDVAYRLRCELQGHEDDVRGICVCGDLGIATSSRDKTVSFVGPVIWIEPNEEFAEGGLVSGGMDTLVLVWDLAKGEKVHTLKGHKLQVTGLVMDDSDIVSSSVDSTLIRWRKGQVVDSWEGHSSAIQSIIKLPSGSLFQGQALRLSCLCAKACGSSFKCSSDTTPEIAGEREIMLAHICRHTDTVRGLAYMADLGILSASHDGKRVGGLKLEELPGLDALQIPGSADGQTKVVREGDNGVAYAWNAREQIWDKLAPMYLGRSSKKSASISSKPTYNHIPKVSSAISARLQIPLVSNVCFYYLAEWLMHLIKRADITSSSPANLLTTIRALVNLFKDSNFHNCVAGARSEIIDVYASCYSASNKNVQLSFATLLLNYSVLLIERRDEEGQTQVLSAALEIAEDEKVDVDSKYRALVAIGSLMLEGLVKKIALDLDVASVASLAKASKDTKIAQVGADIELLSK
ncbi:unnamed protein product [Rhodiola kirilowii]